MSQPPSVLADQALENLVNQFARPLDCLRELVQNSIDAGTPRIEVSAGFEADTDSDGIGVLMLKVQDFGEGMDEAIIDGQLTRMFSSGKEGDLTKIGKFGIGFTSIFAIRPDAVRLLTGRHGQYWEVLFHADRSFEKRPLDEPVSGTCVVLYKRMALSAAEAFAREAEHVLRYWVEHADRPILWTDKLRAAPEAKPAPVSDDPFADFTAEPDIGTSETRLSRPLDLPGAHLSVESRDGGRHIVLGFADEPTHGFYSGGLTLVSGGSGTALGPFREALGHLSFKVRDDRLDHTLTRDSVLHNEHWRAAMLAVSELRKALLDQLLVTTERATLAGESLERWHRLLAREARNSDLNSRIRSNPDRALFRGCLGEPLSPRAVDLQEARVGSVLVAARARPLEHFLATHNVAVIEATSPTRTLLGQLARHYFGIGATRSVRNAEQVYIIPQRIAIDALPMTEHTLFRVARRMLAFATESRVDLVVGEFGGDGVGRHKVLCLEGPDDVPLFKEAGSGFLPAWLRRRTLLVNRNHPHLDVLRLLAATSPTSASFALCQALLHIDAKETRDTWERLELAASRALAEASP